MSVLDDLLRKHRKRIIDREEQAFRELLSAYDDVQRDLRRQFLELQTKIKDATAAGEKISPSWFARERRLTSLLDAVKLQIERFGGAAAAITSREQLAAMEIAVSQAKETISLVSGKASGVSSQIGSTFNPRVVENAVGMMGDGSPILEYYKTKLAPAVAEAIRSEVIKAAAIGTDFATIASRLMAAGDITRTRALATARTEVNRVRRETTRQFYLDNSDVIKGWEWVAAKSPRTCPVCLALDGRIFKLEDIFPQHINCRCTMIPVIDGVDRPKRTLGSEWFDTLPDENKAVIIGVDGVRAYNEGLIELKDFIGWRNSKEFGKSVYTRPLSQILAEKPVADRVIKTPSDIQVLFQPGTRETLDSLIGRALTHDQIGGLVGALDGAHIEVADFGDDSIYFNVTHPLVAKQVRSIGLDEDGRLFMHNHIYAKSRTAPAGMGLKSFATQVRHAEQFGVEYIDTEAVGDYDQSRSSGQKWNGYYTWPRMGYNAELDESDWAKFPKTFRGIPDLNSLFEQTNGKFVWRYHGTGRNMLFDLDRNERAWRILHKYLQDEGFTVRF